MADLINGTRQQGDWEHQKFREDSTGKPAVAVVTPDMLAPGVDFDYLDVAATSGTVDTLTYKNGGAGGTTVRTLTVTYTSPSVSKISDTFDKLEFA